MKRILIIMAFAGLLAGASACGQHGDNAANPKAAGKKGKYVCTMHPSITSDTPGICPKCGMELVERDTTADKK